jgi:cytochrome P450
VQSIVDTQIETMLSLGSAADLVKDFALPVTSLVICELLGVPYDVHEMFEQLTGILLSTVASADEASRANAEVGSFLREQFAAKTAEPADDVLSHLAAEVSEGHLTRDEAINTAYLLLIAGHETTAGQISLGAVTLMQHPEQLDAMIADPGLVDNAIEEILRYIGVSQAGRRRIAVGDIDIGDVHIKAGDGLIILGNSANRDDTIFEDPDTFDIRRTNASSHVEFGAGTHICLGRPLARLELQVVFSTLFQRVPTLALAVPFEELSFKYDATVYGMHALPVEW